MVLTGRNRRAVRPRSPARRRTPRPRRPSRSRSAPPAASRVSEGSTVFSLRISGSPSTPSRSASVSASTRRSNQRLLVWKNGCRSMSVACSSSSARVCAVSRSTSRPSLRRRTRWPPLRSAGVRRQTSAAYGAPLVANHPPSSRPGSRRGCRRWTRRRSGSPASSSRCRVPGRLERGVEVAVPGRAPLQRRVVGPLDRGQVVGAQLGLAVLQEVRPAGRRPAGRGSAASASSVSSRVRKLSMNSSGSRTP